MLSEVLTRLLLGCVRYFLGYLKWLLGRCYGINDTFFVLYHILIRYDHHTDIVINCHNTLFEYTASTT